MIGPPVRAYDNETKLCATNRRTPTACPAESRWSVLSVRRRLVGARSRSRWRGFTESTDPNAVSCWTITSGLALPTACATWSGSSASATAGTAPSSRSMACFDSLRVMP